MIDPDLDLDRLGDVWRQEPDPAELAELRRAAEAARHRARWAQRIDTTAALVLAAVLTLLVARNPHFDTLLVGGAAILFLLITQVRQRRLRAAELKSLTGTSEEMLDQLIDRVRHTLKRSRLGLILAVPGILTGLLVGHVFEGSSGGEIAALLDAYGVGNIVVVVFTVGFAVAALHVARQYRRSQRELERLVALREAYRQERESSMVNELPPDA
jgi:hypothetical protein